jgi:Transcription factor WhiB
MPVLANAACREPHIALLFEEPRGSRGRDAKAACNRCWDRPECLAWGLEREDTGVWGSHGPAGLRRLRKRFGIPLREITAVSGERAEMSKRGDIHD